MEHDSYSIPLDEAAVCLDDKIIFSVRNLVCPKCGAENGWYLLQRVERHGDFNRFAGRVLHPDEISEDELEGVDEEKAGQA